MPLILPPIVGSEVLVFDPVTEDPRNVPLSIDDGLLNLIPNPSGEVDASLWTNGGFSTFQQQTPGVGYVGPGGFRFISGALAPAGQVAAQATLASPTAYLTVAGGETFSLKAMIFCGVHTGSAAAYVQMNWYDAAGAFIGASAGTTISAVTAGFTASVLTVTLPANARRLEAYVVANGGGAGGTIEGYFDAVQLTQTAAAPAYFDGDSANCRWLGTPHASPSTNLLVSTATGYSLLDLATPSPPIDTRWAVPDDADGDVPVHTRYKNREVRLKIEITAPTTIQTESLLAQIEAKLAKLVREGGTLQRMMPSGKVGTFDVLNEATGDPTWDIAWSTGNYCVVDVTLTCKPFIRGLETGYASHTEATLPFLVFTETLGPAGDVPALGRLVLTEAQGVDQAWAAFGVQSRFYDSSADAALFYQAESRTRLGTTLALPQAGASGAGSNIIQEFNVGTDWGYVMSTQASGGGNHHTHVGSFRFIARISRSDIVAGDMSIRLDWAAGEFVNVTHNDEVVLVEQDREDVANFLLVDLGIVTLPKVVSGTQRWEGRIAVKSTGTGDRINVDCYALIPVSECSGEASATQTITPTGTWTVRDDFDQAAGNLAGTISPLGGTWQGAGDADGFTIDAAAHVAQRVATADVAAVGRWATVTGSTLANTVVSCMFGGATASNIYTGILARYTNTSNFLRAVCTWDGTFSHVIVQTVVAGGALLLVDFIPLVNGTSPRVWGLRLTAQSSGRWLVEALAADGKTVIASRSGTHASLATGGANASGLVGIYEENRSATATARTYDSFRAYPFLADAVAFAGKTCQFRHDGAVRDAASGTADPAISIFEGDNLLIPPAGRENRSVRVIAKFSRNNRDGIDLGIDDISGQLFVTPRYLQLPT